MRRIPCKAPVLLALACLAAPPLRAQVAGGFVPGDLYLHTPAATGVGTGSGGLMHFDLLSGSAAIPLSYVTTHTPIGAATYDPYRKRILFCAALQGISTLPRLLSTDAAGNVTDLGLGDGGFEAMAPTGDGRIYLHPQSDNTAPFRYLDAANRMRVLVDSTGLLPYRVPGVNGFLFVGMLHDAATNALFVASSAGVAACPGGTSQDVNIRKLPLSADGTRVVGPESCAQFNVYPGSNKEFPVGFSRLPSGHLLLTVDTSSNAMQPRLLAIDPVTLGMSVFAENGAYNGAASVVSGAWSSALGRVVILDSVNDVFRSFAAGETGSGTLHPTALPPSHVGSAGERATLQEISDDGCAGGFIPYGTGLAGSGGFVPTLTASGCAEPGGSVSVHLRDVVGGTAGLLFVGTGATSVPYHGGSFLVLPIVLTVPVTTTGAPGSAGAGTRNLPGGIASNPGFSGISVFLQGLFLDTGAPAGVSLTQGLQIEIG